MKKNWKGIVYLVIGLSLLSLIFYSSNYVLQLKERNSQELSSLSSSDFWKGDKIFPEGKAIENFLRYLPEVRNDVKLKDVLVDVTQDMNDIGGMVMLKDMLQGKKDALIPLQNLDQNFAYLQKYNLDFIDNWKKQTQNWLLFLGERKHQHYLVIFQDPEIPRPSGGLLGAYAILSFDQGKIDLKGDNIFVLDNLFFNKVVPPFPLRFISNKWFFHDLNWFFDFPFTGRKILEYYNQLGLEQQLDGVISINPEAMEAILSVLGPIEIKKYDLNIKDTTFKSFFQNQITEGAQQAAPETPRDSFTLFIENFRIKLSSASPSQLQQIVSSLQDSLNNKEIQLFFQDDTLEYYFDSLNGTGKVLATPNDYLAVVISSLQRGLDRSQAERNITLQSDFTSSGVTNMLTISSRGGQNKEEYLQVYLPAGITIIKAQNSFLKKNPEPWSYADLGFTEDIDVNLLERVKICDDKNNIEIFEESGKTVVACWVHLALHPFVIQYKIPYEQNTTSWKLQLQKQSGQKVKFSYSVNPISGQSIRPTLFPLGSSIPLEGDTDITLHFIPASNL